MERLTHIDSKGWYVDDQSVAFDERRRGAIIDRLAAYEDIGPVDEVAELMQAKKDGRLAEIPCKVGDTVYVTFGKEYRPYVVDRIHILANCNVQVRMRHSVTETLWLPASKFGKTVFFTTEEAEAALKGGAE